jgi:hypothetical protein
MTEPGFTVHPVSWILLAITIAASIFAFRSERFRFAALLYPWDVVRKREYYRLFSYGFIHADFHASGIQHDRALLGELRIGERHGKHTAGSVVHRESRRGGGHSRHQTSG